MTAVPKPELVRDPAFRRWLVEHWKLGCVACGTLSPLDPAHVHTRRNAGDERNVVPLCHRCHDLQHRHGWSRLARRYGLTQEKAAKIASHIWDLWLKAAKLEKLLPF